MSISVSYGGEPVPKSPFNISVAPPLDLNKVRVHGLDKSECLIKTAFHLFIGTIIVIIF